MNNMQHSTRGGRRTPAAQVVEHLRASDRFPSGDPRREAAQRRAARAAAADPSLIESPLLAGVRAQLRRWARFAPYLLTDREETELAATNRAIVTTELARLRSLDDDPITALATADAALRDLDADAVERRRAADVEAHRVTDRRAAPTASVLGSLAACHLADDRLRGIVDWRTRFAFVQGTRPETLAALRDATRAAHGLAAGWWSVRAPLVGAEYCDRRVGLAAPPASLTDHARAAAAALAAAVPELAEGARAAASRITPGADNQVVIEADGRISVTVAHRPTPRGSLMVAHEIGHALHALAAESPEPPGALVGETVACWSSLVTGMYHVDDGHDSSGALALAVGDTLVEELFVSAAVSAFEDSVYSLAARGDVTAADLNAAWLSAQRDVWGESVAVPDHVASGWARLPALAAEPGHAFSYVWATVLALAIDARHHGDAAGVIANAILAGGIEADEFTALIGFEGDEWIEVGLSALADQLDRLGQLVRSGISAGRAP
jgi:hypothetical protein